MLPRIGSRSRSVPVCMATKLGVEARRGRRPVAILACPVSLNWRRSSAPCFLVDFQHRGGIPAHVEEARFRPFNVPSHPGPGDGLSGGARLPHSCRPDAVDLAKVKIPEALKSTDLCSGQVRAVHSRWRDLDAWWCRLPGQRGPASPRRSRAIPIRMPPRPPRSATWRTSCSR